MIDGDSGQIGALPSAISEVNVLCPLDINFTDSSLICDLPRLRPSHRARLTGVIDSVSTCQQVFSHPESLVPWAYRNMTVCVCWCLLRNRHSAPSVPGSRGWRRRRRYRQRRRRWRWRVYKEFTPRELTPRGAGYWYVITASFRYVITASFGYVITASESLEYVATAFFAYVAMVGLPWRRR
jgi:hypothetical protein